MGLLHAEQLPTALTSIGSGAIPPEVDLLLRELVLHRPVPVAGGSPVGVRGLPRTRARR